MIAIPQSLARLQFFARVATKEGTHLQSTDQRLFAERFTELRARSLDDDPALAERVEAFVARFGRCQRHGWLATADKTISSARTVPPAPTFHN